MDHDPERPHGPHHAHRLVSDQVPGRDQRRRGPGIGPGCLGARPSLRDRGRGGPLRERQATRRRHRLRARYDGSGSRVTLHAGREERSFRLDAEREALAAWLGAFFGFPVEVRADPESGFPDDKEASGPTIISTATLASVAGWFPARSEEQMRMRFRANLEIGEVPAFWEDRLYGEPGTTVRFIVGAVCFEGTNPCQRCVVPTRDPLTGTEDRGFQKTLAARRRETLPAWAARSRFNHFYRLAVNTRIPPSEAGKPIRVGDPVEIVGPG